MAGIDPYAQRWTLRQLVDAAAAVSRRQWEHTSHVLAVLYNANRASGQAAVSADELNPYKARAIARRKRQARRIERLESVRARHDALAKAGRIQILTSPKVIECPNSHS